MHYGSGSAMAKSCGYCCSGSTALRTAKSLYEGRNPHLHYKGKEACYVFLSFHLIQEDELGYQEVFENWLRNFFFIH
jgi:hypothetical protein